MEFSYIPTDELLNLSPSPEQHEAQKAVCQAPASAEVEDFDWHTFIAGNPETLDQSAGLYSQDAALIGVQTAYNENMRAGSSAKSTSNHDTYANVPCNQIASWAYSGLNQPMVSSNVPSSSSQSVIQPGRSVDPMSLLLPSPIPSANYNLIPPALEFGDFYIDGQELPDEFDWVSQQILEQVRLGQEKFEQPKLEQVGLEKSRVEEQPIPNYTNLAALNINFEEEMQAGREANHHFAKIHPMPAELPHQEFGQEMMVSRPLLGAKNMRSANRKGFDPTQHYRPLLQTPQNWGSISARTGYPTFQYNEQGELKPTTRFTVEKIKEYFDNHPLHSDFTVNPHPPTAKTSGLILWVQICPADSKHRYGDQNQSSKCRFENCPHPLNTIEKGEYRVTFDEQWCRQRNNDPFHNAGYVHLYCLEKNFDFPRICKDMNVRADTRQLPEEREKKNKMAITRDSPSMEKVVNEYIKNSVSWGGQMPQDFYKDTLCWALTAEKLNREPKSHKKKRDSRGGNNLDVHLNDVDHLAMNLDRKKQGLPFISHEMPTPTSEKPQVKKRKTRDNEAESSLPTSPSKRPRATEQPSRAATPKSLTRKSQRPRTLNLTSQHIQKQSNKFNSSMKRPHPTKRESQDDHYVASAEEIFSRVKRRKVARKPQEFPHNDSEYDADESGSSSSSTSPQTPLTRHSAARRVTLGTKQGVRSLSPATQRPQGKKRKSREFEGEKTPTEIFREQSEAMMKRYGLNKKHERRRSCSDNPTW